FVEDKNTAAKSFTEKYESQFGSSPLGFAYLSYDAAQIVVNAIKETDSTDWATIVAAMKKTDIDCLTGHYKFDEQNNPLKQCAMKIIKDGKYTADRMY
ncbi:MAG: ABC transporter substrate-binding protein, partial [Oscillospiraceae bacterium]